MKKLIPLLLALFCSPAFATLSIVSGHLVSGNPPGTCAIQSSVGTGQVVAALLEGGGSGITITDSVNTGSYSLLYSPAAAYKIFWITTNASGTPTLTISGSSGSTFVQCFAITGFTGTPTSDVTIQNSASATSTNPAINATSNFNNEMMIVQVYDSAGSTVTVSGWTALSGANWYGFTAFEATSGTANNFNGTIGTSQSWHITLAGIYDLPSGSCTHQGKTSAGGFAVPNGSTGSYKLANGTIGTPDCSTKIYCNSAGSCAVN